MGSKVIDFFDFLKGTLITMKENIEDLNIDSGFGSKDLDEVLRNPEDRLRFEEAVEKLKSSGKKSETVTFSDRELEISIE